MKTTILCAAALLTAALTAGAWPFVPRSTNLWTPSAQSDYLFFQADNDRALEVYCGGDKLMHPVAGGQGSSADLPQFDYDPYYSNWPVTFVDSHSDAGDIDGDGDIDIVRSAIMAYNGVREPNYRMMACLNNGTGQFTRGWHFKQLTAVTGMGAESPLVKLADLDRDGDLDLVSNFPNLRVHWNPGNGDFSSSVESLYTSAYNLDQLAVADFNNDGWPDIAACVNVIGADSEHPQWVAGRLVLLTNDHGTFSAAVQQTLSKSYFNQAAAADLNQDGRMDLVVFVGGDPATSGIYWFRNTGSGFAAMAALAPQLDYYKTIFAVGDLDEDGRVDLAYTEFEHEVKWLHATGGGHFQPAVTLYTENALTAPLGLSIADIDGDADNDLIFDAGWHVLENTGIHHGFGSSVTDFGGIQPTGDVDLAVADVNGDGHGDLIAADGGGKRLLWYATNGSSLDTGWPVSTSSIATSVTAGDFNRDGFTDFAWTTTNAIGRAYSTNGSGFSWNYAGLATMTGVTHICTADGDNDGDSDILALSPASVRWYKNDGSGGGWLPEAVYTGGSGMSAICAGQEIPGGRPEVATIVAGSGSGYYQRHRFTTGSGWGYSVGANKAGGTPSNAVIMADVASATPGLETIYAMNENTFRVHHPSLSVPVEGAAPADPINQLAVTDWNRDGYADILCATDKGVHLYFNQRTPSWTMSAGFDLYYGNAVQDLVIMDLNRDGLPDAVAVEATTGKLHLIYNGGAQIKVTHAAPAATNLSPGASGTMAAITAASFGRFLGDNPIIDDACAAPAEVRLRFTRAVLQNGAWVPGAAMTQAEISSVVQNVSINNGASAAAPSGVTNGVFYLPVTGPMRTLLCIEPGAIKSFNVSLSLKSTAGTSSTDRFFVETSNAGSWFPLDAHASYAPGPVPLDLTPSSLVRTLVEVMTPLKSWRDQNFGHADGTGNRANDADYDSDGVPNLVEYVTGTDPAANEPVLNTNNGLYVFKPSTMQSPLKFRLAISAAAMSDPGVKVSVQMSGGLTGWATLADRTGGGAWSGLQPDFAISGNGVTTHVFTTTYTPQNTKKFFLRLKVEELP